MALLNNNFDIQIIPFGSELYQGMKNLREDILRKPLNLTLNTEDLEGEEKQIHIAALTSDQKIAATVVLKPATSEHIKLRQMAVDTLYQRQGLGQRLVNFAEDFTKANGYNMISLWARLPAVEFYKKLGYEEASAEIVERTIRCITMKKAF